MSFVRQEMIWPKIRISNVYRYEAKKKIIGVEKFKGLRNWKFF